jgi:hypothetical protein
MIAGMIAALRRDLNLPVDPARRGRCRWTASSPN